MSKNKKYKPGKRYDYGPSRPDQTHPPETMYFQIENYELAAWSPDPVPGRSPATEVHFFLEIKGLPDVKQFMRFKSPAGLDQFIDLLIEYRENVWGERNQDDQDA